MRTYYATAQELKQLRRNFGQELAMTVLNGVSTAGTVINAASQDYFRSGLWAALFVITAVIFFRVRRQTYRLKQHIRDQDRHG